MTVETTSTDLQTLSDAQRRRVLDLAEASIRHGLEHGEALQLTSDQYDGALAETRATFVSVYVADELDGCVGSLEATRPLAEDIVHNAYVAAFDDPRFDEITADRLEKARLEVSLLSPLRPLEVDDEADLVGRLTPGVHGVFLECGPRRGTLLPKVWEACPEPDKFVDLVKRKAGLPPGHWNDRIQAYTYTVESFDSGG